MNKDRLFIFDMSKGERNIYLIPHEAVELSKGVNSYTDSPIYDILDLLTNKTAPWSLYTIKLVVMAAQELE